MFSAIISEYAYDSTSLQYSPIRSVSFQIFKSVHCEGMHVSSFLRCFKGAAVTYHLLLEDLQDFHCEEAWKMSTFCFQRYILKWWHIYFKAWKMSTFVKYCRSWIESLKRCWKYREKLYYMHLKPKNMFRTYEANTYVILSKK